MTECLWGTTCERITVRISQGDEISMNGVRVDSKSLKTSFGMIRTENADLPIYIEADPKVKTGAIIRVRDALYDAGYARYEANLALAPFGGILSCLVLDRRKFKGAFRFARH